jgi:hypothetical protein
LSDANNPTGFSPVVGAIPRAADFRDVYSNQARLTITPSDFNLIFSRANDRGPGLLMLEDLISVRLAPLTAKTISLHLQAVIEAFESAMGTILMPAGAESQIEAYRHHLTEMLATQMGRPAQSSS